MQFAHFLASQLYATIVGDCAWEPNGCPITQQNYIDFIYATLSEIGSGDWPRFVASLLTCLPRN